MTTVQVLRLSHDYKSRKPSPASTPALSDVNFSVEKGQLFGLLGPNGGGKTTLFRILSTALTPTSGTAVIAGENVVQAPHRVRHAIGVVFQSPSLDKHLTVRENLVHQGRLYGLSGVRLEERIKRALSNFNLESRQDDRAAHLSGGLQRRLEIAKALLHDPRVILMDEPSTGLDPGARRDLWAIIAELKQAGSTILFTTHLMDEGERADGVAILDQGRIRALGRPADLISKIGGDVITIQTETPEALSQKITERFGGTPLILDGTIRIEKEEGHRFIPQLVEAFPGLVQAVTLGKPNLEDVFVKETGHRL